MHGFPPVTPGLRIGLLGGSFNPPHDAHRAATLFAMKRLELDVALPVLFARRPGLRLAAPPCFADRYHFRALEALWVE